LHSVPYYLECIFWVRQSWKGEWHSGMWWKVCMGQDRLGTTVVWSTMACCVDLSVSVE